jgi:hypothetical protein
MPGPESTEGEPIDLRQIIEDLMTLIDDGDNRTNTLYHVYSLVLDGDVDEGDARRALLGFGFSEEEIDEIFDPTEWNEEEVED